MGFDETTHICTCCRVVGSSDTLDRKSSSFGLHIPISTLCRFLFGRILTGWGSGRTSKNFEKKQSAITIYAILSSSFMYVNLIRFGKWYLAEYFPSAWYTLEAFPRSSASFSATFYPTSHRLLDGCLISDLRLCVVCSLTLLPRIYIPQRKHPLRDIIYNP